MDTQLVDQIKILLLQRKENLATAESCTGGRVGQLITSVSGASVIYAGGVITYSDEAKKNILQVPSRILEQYGAVSEQTAFWMAAQTRKLFDTDWAISITGIAGPSGGSAEKPVGMVAFGWSSAFGTITQTVKFRPVEREQIQARAALHALNGLKKLLLQH